MEASSLQSILATLAQFGQPGASDNSQTTGLASPEPQRPVGASVAQSNGSALPSPGEHRNAAASLNGHQLQDPRLRSQTQSGTASPRPMIDPARITQWQEGLRCVTKIAAQNAHFASCIKRVSWPLSTLFRLIDTPFHR